MADNNVILTTRTYAGLILFDLRSNLRIVKNMTNSVTPEFAKGAYKVGDEIKVRRPYRFVGGEGIEERCFGLVSAGSERGFVPQISAVAHLVCLAIGNIGKGSCSISRHCHIATTGCVKSRRSRISGGTFHL